MRTRPGGTALITVTVGIGPLEEDGECLGQQDHGDAGGETVPGIEGEDTIEPEIGVAMHEEPRRDGRRKDQHE